MPNYQRDIVYGEDRGLKESQEGKSLGINEMDVRKLAGSILDIESSEGFSNDAIYKTQRDMVFAEKKMTPEQFMSLDNKKKDMIAFEIKGRTQGAINRKLGLLHSMRKNLGNAAKQGAAIMPESAIVDTEQKKLVDEGRRFKKNRAQGVQELLMESDNSRIPYILQDKLNDDETKKLEKIMSEDVRALKQHRGAVGRGFDLMATGMYGVSGFLGGVEKERLKQAQKYKKAKTGDVLPDGATWLDLKPEDYKTDLSKGYEYSGSGKQSVGNILGAIRAGVKEASENIKTGGQSSNNLSQSLQDLAVVQKDLSMKEAKRIAEINVDKAMESAGPLSKEAYEQKRKALYDIQVAELYPKIYENSINGDIRSIASQYPHIVDFATSVLLDPTPAKVVTGPLKAAGAGIKKLGAIAEKIAPDAVGGIKATGDKIARMFDYDFLKKKIAKGIEKTQGKEVADTLKDDLVAADKIRQAAYADETLNAINNKNIPALDALSTKDDLIIISALKGDPIALTAVKSNEKLKAGYEASKRLSDDAYKFKADNDLMNTYDESGMVVTSPKREDYIFPRRIKTKEGEKFLEDIHGKEQKVVNKNASLKPYTSSALERSNVPEWVYSTRLADQWKAELGEIADKLGKTRAVKILENANVTPDLAIKAERDIIKGIKGDFVLNKDDFDELSILHNADVVSGKGKKLFFKISSDMDEKTRGKVFEILEKETGTKWYPIDQDLNDAWGLATKTSLKRGSYEVIAPKEAGETLRNLFPIIQKKGSEPAKEIAKAIGSLFNGVDDATRISVTLLGGSMWHIFNAMTIPLIDTMTFGAKKSWSDVNRHASSLLMSLIHNQIGDKNFRSMQRFVEKRLGGSKHSPTGTYVGQYKEVAKTFKDGTSVTMEKVLGDLRKYAVVGQMEHHIGYGGDKIRNAMVAIPKFLAEHSPPELPLPILFGKAKVLSTKSVGNLIEDMQHITSYLGFLEGTSEAHIRRAVRLASEFSGDMRRITPTEKSYIKNKAMFYTWTKIAISLFVSQMAKRPELTAKMVAGRRELQEAGQEKFPHSQFVEPTHARDVGYVTRAPSNSDEFVFAVMNNPDVIIQQMSKQLVPHLGGGDSEAYLKLLAPTTRFMIESMIGRDMDTWKPISVWPEFSLAAIATEFDKTIINGEKGSTVLTKYLAQPVQKPSQQLRNAIRLLFDNGKYGEAWKLAAQYTIGYSNTLMTYLLKAAGKNSDMKTGTAIPGIREYPVNPTSELKKSKQRPVEDYLKSGIINRESPRR